LRRAGWTVGDVGAAWLVTGHNDENLIRAEGATRADAWRAAVEQAMAAGILGPWRMS
jgi:hypothetical protein